MFTLIKLTLAAVACVIGAAAPAMASPAVHGNGPASVAGGASMSVPFNRCPPPQPHCNQY